jgi:hypothetical protein
LKQRHQGAWKQGAAHTGSGAWSFATAFGAHQFEEKDEPSMRTPATIRWCESAVP